MEVVTPELFEEWRHNPVTRKLMKMLYDDREQMKEGLVYNSYEEAQEIQGRCRVIAIILDIGYEDMFPTLVKREVPEDE